MELWSITASGPTCSTDPAMHSMHVWLALTPLQSADKQQHMRAIGHRTTGDSPMKKMALNLVPRAALVLGAIMAVAAHYTLMML